MAQRTDPLFWGSIYKKKQNDACCPLFFTEDSSSIHFSGFGTQQDPLTAISKISATAGNTITINSDGIYSSGGGGSITGANDGLSVSGANAVLGQTVGQVGNPALVTENREIPLGSNSLFLTFPGVSNSLILFQDGQLQVQYPSNSSNVALNGFDGTIVIGNNTGNPNVTGEPYLDLQAQANESRLSINNATHYVTLNANNSSVVTNINALKYSGSVLNDPGTLMFGPATTTSTGDMVQITGAGITGSIARGNLLITDTWNTTGSPSAIKVNITNTASGASATLLSLGVAGTPSFTVSPIGLITATNLSGAGTRMVVANSTGILSTQAIPPSSANNGLSVTGGIVTLGQTIGQLGSPASLLHATEIPLNTFTLNYLGALNTGGTGVHNASVLIDSGAITISSDSGVQNNPTITFVDYDTPGYSGFITMTDGLMIMQSNNLSLIGTTNGVSINGNASGVNLNGTVSTGTQSNTSVIVQSNWNTSGNPILINGLVTGTPLAYGATSKLLDFSLNGTSVYTIYPDGRASIKRTGAATAAVHIGAGSATAGTAPIKLTAGPLLTTPEDGTFEFDGTHLYFTIGSTRSTII